MNEALRKKMRSLSKYSALDAGLSQATDTHFAYRTGYEAGFTAALNSDEVKSLITALEDTDKYCEHSGVKLK